MNNRLFSILACICLCLVGSLGFSQTVTYDTQVLPPSPVGVSVTLSEIKEDFAPRLIHLEAPSPSGESYRSFLEREKKKVAKRFPIKASAPSAKKASAQTPLSGRSFQGNFDNRGIPLDTHVGISNAGQVVSVINGDVLVRDIDGNILFGISLDAFFTPIGLENAFPFDPKIHYDPETDRWILCALGRYTNTQISRIFLAFSKTADATGDWNLYKLDGNPLVTNTWIDYPMLSISHHEIFLTGNSVRWNEPWQTGFDQTMIWQINKGDGHNGNSLRTRIWSNIQFGGVFLRNMCPVKGGTGNYGPNQYFLSNRNFDMQNNAIFMVELKDTINAPGTNLLLDVRASDVNYGLAPNGRQSGGGGLATNDSRILDAFLWNDAIQFVGNSIDTTTGRPSVYHGFIDNVSTTKEVSGYIISHDSLDMGYPSLAYTGSDDVSWGEEDAVIFFDVSSPDHPATVASVYYDNNGEHSELFRTKSGSGYIDVLAVQDERWGDYTGCQRKYDEPGTVWTMGTVGLADNRAAAWISEYFRPGPPAAISTPKPNIQLKAYPNPARAFVQVEFEIPQGESIHISLVNTSGQVVRTFFDDTPKSAGTARFSFSTTPLARGVYVLKVAGKSGMLATKRIVVQ